MPVAVAVVVVVVAAITVSIGECTVTFSSKLNGYTSYCLFVYQLSTALSLGSGFNVRRLDKSIRGGIWKPFTEPVVGSLVRLGFVCLQLSR